MTRNSLLLPTLGPFKGKGTCVQAGMGAKLPAFKDSESPAPSAPCTLGALPAPLGALGFVLVSLCRCSLRPHRGSKQHQLLTLHSGGWRSHTGPLGCLLVTCPLDFPGFQRPPAYLCLWPLPSSKPTAASLWLLLLFSHLSAG